MTIDEIKSRAGQAGSKFFTPGNMRWHNSRISSKTFKGPGGVYFITSEADGHMPRRYSVRRFDPETSRINTVAWHAFNFIGDAYRYAVLMASGAPIPEPVSKLYALGGEDGGR